MVQVAIFVVQNWSFLAIYFRVVRSAARAMWRDIRRARIVPIFQVGGGDVPAVSDPYIVALYLECTAC